VAWAWKSQAQLGSLWKGPPLPCMGTAGAEGELDVLDRGHSHGGLCGRVTSFPYKLVNVYG
jgi:hypothetical protein